MTIIAKKLMGGGKTLSYLLAGVLAFCSLDASAFSICAVGDSITQGASHFTAHRIALENEFDALGWIVEWKGTKSDASWGTSNPCEGYSGKNAVQIATEYKKNAASVVADVLLLHAGHNYNADPNTTSPACLPEADIVKAATNAHEQIITAARKENPNVIVLYAKVITSSKLPKYSYISALNEGIGALAADLTTETSPVVTVDMAEGWNPASDCVSDQVHPTATGAAKMAKKWIAAIKTLNAAGKISNSLNITTDTTLYADVRCDSVSVSPSATLNLNGHRLMTGGISGSGTIVSASSIESYALPEGYTLLSYVQTQEDNNTASSYIDTVIIPLATDRIETKVGLGNVGGTQWIFGSYTTDQRFDAYVTSSKLYYHLGSKSATINVTTATYEIILDGSRRNGIYAKNGEASGKLTIASGGKAPDRRIYLFGANNNGPVYSGRMANSCKMYYFRVYDKDGNIKANMLPAKNPDGVVGFYDLVRNQFFAPANGELRAGTDITFERVEYVVTPADNSSFVDTGYTPLLTDRVETKVRFGSLSSNQGIFSARQTAAKNTFSCVLFSEDASRKLRFDHYTSSPYVYHRAEGATADTSYATDKDYEIVMNGNTCTFAVNGDISSTELTANVDASANPALTLRLFAVATKGDGHSVYAKSCRMYYFRLTDANGYERLNLIPVRKTADAQVGFYDVAHNAFITLNSGTFEAGEKLFGELSDLTSPGGVCKLWPNNSNIKGTAGNLFSNNFEYGQDTVRRILVPKTLMPIRVDYDFGENNAVAVNMYKIYAGYNLRAPKKWVFYGSNDESAFEEASDDLWIPLDSQESQTGWTIGPDEKNLPADCRVKMFCNDVPYRYYRLKVEEGGDDPKNYLELVQLEYFRVNATDNPGELHLNVPEGEKVENSALKIGGDLKVIKKGAGEFVSSVSKQFYTGGTEVKAGTFTLGAPLVTSLTVASDATLGFLFRSRDSVPLLTLGADSVIPSPLNVAISCDGKILLLPEGVEVSTGYDFSGKTVNFVNKLEADYVRAVKVNEDGNLVACGRTGFNIVVR